ncbi:amino acid adenylation domain-containing protein [Kitasatospora sp. NPDC048365]|uniref:non-ribosomal peptide synthetase n=1 Tax=Kitasatospora sp. NPDC048365 TaxID=3364050 RepID=UPI00371216EF
MPAPALAGAERALPDGGVLDLFEARAQAAPDAIALVCRGERHTYGRLDRAADAAARRLAAAGVGRGTTVAVATTRSAASVVAMVAVWKLDAVVLPVDPRHPDDRIAFLLDDAGAGAVLADGASAPRFGSFGPPVVPVTDGLPEEAADTAEPLAPRGPVTDRSPAYLLYTSGSTGQPKGVRGSHRALLNVVLELADALRTTPESRWATLAPWTFDISLGELWVPLATGARLVVPTEEELRDAAALVRLLAAEGVDRMQAVPAQWTALLDAGFDGPSTRAMTGGEALTPALAQRLRPRLADLVNGYGPTETTVLSTLWRVPADLADGAVTAIGRPIANTRAYLLDDLRRPVAPGEPGELYLAGAGVTLGYLNRPALDAERFSDEPGVPGSRCYRTGDRCRIGPGGVLEYLGREDGQVKLRGQRIELGEVESRLAEHPGLGAAAATVHEDTLIAFVVPAAHGESAPTGAQVRAHMAALVPEALVPGVVVTLDRLPLTAHDKVDRAALSALAADRAAPAEAAEPGEPRTTAAGSLVDEVCGLCQEVLGVPLITPADDLFALGAHSLAMMQLAARLGTLTGVEVPTTLIYDAETVADLVEELRALLPGAAR